MCQCHLLLQSESPSTTKLNNLGAYLLVSLFFVVAAMLEFALVLLVQRKLDATRNSFANEHMKTTLTKRKHKTSNTSTFDDTTSGWEDLRKDGNLHNKQTEKVPRLACLQLSTDNIDMMACVLFITLYVLYNLFYWM